MKKLGTVLMKILCVLLETVLLLLLAVLAVVYILEKGPSPTARDLFVRSVRETSAMGWVANLFLSESEIAEITATAPAQEYADTDVSLIQIADPTRPDDPDEPAQPDTWGLVDEDGDGIIIETVSGVGYSGYMMIVLDPSRVILASVPTSYGGRGYTVEQMVEKFGGVAGINAGGFDDPNGTGNGSIPDTMVVFEGKVYYAEYGCARGFAGLDADSILHVGMFTASQIAEKNIQYGVAFGPVLVSNGEKSSSATLSSGVNPRTGIGQRSDGAMLLLVIDGRQVSSMGATYEDMADIFLSYGAVNALNLDGGSSSMMYYGGEYINNCASVVGVRPVPTAFVVLPQEGDSDG